MDRRPVRRRGRILFAVSAWMANSAIQTTAVNGYLPIIVGMMVLFIALAQSVLWALNRARTPPGA